MGAFNEYFKELKTLLDQSSYIRQFDIDLDILLEDLKQIKLKNNNSSYSNR